MAALAWWRDDGRVEDQPGSRPPWASNSPPTGASDSRPPGASDSRPPWTSDSRPPWANGSRPQWANELPAWARDWHDQWTGLQRQGGPLRREKQGRLAGGVAAGITARTGLHVTIVRIIIVIAALISGFGAAAYVLAWLFIPAVGEPASIASKALSDRRGIALAAVTASMLALVLVVASALGVGWLTSFSWPPIIAAAGMVLIWRNAPADEQAVLRNVVDMLLGEGAGNVRSRLGLRLCIAVALLIAGMFTLFHGHHGPNLLRPLGGLILVIAAAVVVFGPWWLRVARDNMIERQARIRAEERAEIATRVHDSVLQTLALIQRRADNPQEVIKLARSQERELRAWLFDGRAPGSMDGLAVTLSGGVRLIQQEVEGQHGVVVEAITVGDCELDDDLGALLAAAREATVNAAKWSGVRVVSLFAEVEPAAVSVFVRDRGRGFDQAAVPLDRKGLTESISARMTRRGGTATIRTVPGEGTEVSLRMPRTVGEREPSTVT
jgi:signal transduction histidine kinase